MLAPVYIFYGFESAGDISEETKDAGRQVPRAMRHALIWGGVASFILTAALLLAMPARPTGSAATVERRRRPVILGQLPSGLQDVPAAADHLRVLLLRHLGAGRGSAGSRSPTPATARCPRRKWISNGHQRFKTPVNALLGGAVVTVLFVLLEFASPVHNITILFFTYPANTNVLVSLVSFGVSGIYLSFLLTVIGAMIARRRGWMPAGKFRLGRWAWPVTIVAGVYLLVMLVNVVAPTGLGSPRAYFNLDWITLVVMFVVAIVGVIFFLVAHRGNEMSEHLIDREVPVAPAEPVRAPEGAVAEAAGDPDPGAV